MAKITSLFKNLISFVKGKKLTKRAELLFGCALVVALCLVISFSIVGCKKDAKGGDEAEMSEELDGSVSANAAGNELELSMNEADKDYDKDADVVDEDKYKDTVLQESEDAGIDYIKETLFIGDSNTVRMMNYGYTSLENTLAVVGMGIQSVKTLKCVEFAGHSAPVTMVEAVKMMQPRRIIITFGTNNANGMDTDTFIKKYNEAIDAIEEAYPYADILINSVPPFAKMNSYPKLSIISVDKFNVALNEMAKERGLKFINSSSVMKDEKTGYAKAGFMAGDGIHITQEGFEAMFEYIRTHSHIVEDTRPKPLKSVPKQKKATYVIGGDGKMRNDKASYEQMSVDPNAVPLPVLPSTSSSSSANVHEHRFDSGSVVKEPSYDEDGTKEYKCIDCGYKYNERIPKKERPKEEHQHSYQEVSRVEPQPGVAGKRTMKCSGCGDTYETPIDPLPVNNEPTGGNSNPPETGNENTETPGTQGEDAGNPGNQDGGSGDTGSASQGTDNGSDINTEVNNTNENPPIDESAQQDS